MRVLHLLPDARPSAAFHAARSLQAVLPAAEVEPFTAFWSNAEAAQCVRSELRNVHFLNARGLTDIAAVRRLLALTTRLRPDAVHTWGHPLARRVGGLRRLPGAESLRRARWVASLGQATALGAFDRWVTQEARIAAASEPLPILPADGPGTLPDDGRWIVASVRHRTSKAGVAAAWAFDVLRYTHPDLRLLVVGRGTGREQAERFAYSTGRADTGCIQFGDEVPSLTALARQAEAVWLPSSGSDGTLSDCVAAGAAVVAIGSPSRRFAEGDGVRYAPPDDPIAFSRITRQLLERPADRQALIANGRLAARRLGDPTQALERWQRLYGIPALSQRHAA